MKEKLKIFKPILEFILLLYFASFSFFAVEKLLSKFGLGFNYGDFIIFNLAISSYTCLVVFIYLRIKKHPDSYIKSWWPKNILFGACTAILSIIAIVLVDMIINKTEIKFIGMEPRQLLLFVLFFFQSTGEELLSRTIIYAGVKKVSNRLVAIIVSSVIFTLLHYFNAGFTMIPALNLILVSIVFAYLYDYFGIEGASFYHALWNFTHGVVFSLPVSGMFVGGGIFTIRMTPMMYGFGLEGSIISSVILTIFILYLVNYSRNNREKYDTLIIR